SWCDRLRGARAGHAWPAGGWSTRPHEPSASQGLIAKTESKKNRRPFHHGVGVDFLSGRCCDYSIASCAIDCWSFTKTLLPDKTGWAYDGESATLILATSSYAF